MSEKDKSEFSGRTPAETWALCIMAEHGCKLTMQDDKKIYVDGHYFTEGADLTEGVEDNQHGIQ